MDENTNTAVLDGDTTPAEGATKTFTQEQLNAIISERLAKDRAKGEAELVKREQDLQRREFVFSAKETLTNKGLSHELLDALNTSSPEAFTKSLDILEKFVAGISKLQPGAEAALKAQLLADGANPKLVDLLVHAFDYGQIQFDGKNISNWSDISKPVKEKYNLIFGTTQTVGVHVATPPKSVFTEPDAFEEGFNKK